MWLKSCGVACMSLSVWGVLQLTIMGICYKFEALPLVEDAIDPHNPDEEQTEKNYKQLSINCFIASGLYFFMMVISCICIRKGRQYEMAEEEKQRDDEIACIPAPPKKLKVSN